MELTFRVKQKLSRYKPATKHRYSIIASVLQQFTYIMELAITDIPRRGVVFP
jgi:hypothetical protein